jgi:hypothetical protein
VLNHQLHWYTIRCVSSRLCRSPPTDFVACPQPLREKRTFLQSRFVYPLPCMDLSYFPRLDPSRSGESRSVVLALPLPLRLITPLNQATPSSSSSRQKMLRSPVYPPVKHPSSLKPFPRLPPATATTQTRTQPRRRANSLSKGPATSLVQALLLLLSPPPPLRPSRAK